MNMSIGIAVFHTALGYAELSRTLTNVPSLLLLLCSLTLPRLYNNKNNNTK